jgi:curved DNA-binding protein CbpA
MVLSEYYRLLDLSAESSVNDIKRAYRLKARQFHPDINHSPDAKDHFIAITEAYDFLISYHEKIKADEEAYNRAMDEWKRHRQYKARRRANSYARTSYSSFRGSKFYKSTRIFDGTAIIYGFLISILVIVYTVFGYIYRVRHPLPDDEQPSVFAFLAFLSLGILFFTISFVYLKSFISTAKKKGSKTKKND